MNTPPVNWNLEIADKDGDVRSIPLSGPGEWLAGRSRRCDIVIEDPGVSRRQFIIRIRPGHVEVSSHEEASATALVDGRPLAAGQAVTLESSTEIQVAGLIIKLLPVASVPDKPGRPSIDPETPALEEERGPDEYSTAAIPGAGLSSAGRTGETSALPVDDADDHTLAEGPSLVSTRMAPETMATRAAMEAGSMALEQESYGTAFLAEDEAKAIIAAHAARKRGRFMGVTLGSFGLLIALLVLLAVFLPGGQPVEHQATYFTIDLPVGWRASSLGDMTIFKPGRGDEAGVAVWRMQNEAVWRFDYDTAYGRIIEGMRELWSGVWPELTWDPWQGGDNLPVVLLPGESGIPYVLRRGEIDGGGALMLRIYLVRDHCVAVLAWRFGGAASSPVYDALDSFQLNATIIPDFVLRDITWPLVAVDIADTGQWLDDARYLFGQRSADSGNAYRAYRKVLDLIGTGNAAFSVVMLWQDHILPYAAYLQEQYLALRAPMLAAAAAADHKTSAMLARELQALIPDRKDPRWVWAQRILSDAESAQGRSRRF